MNGRRVGHGHVRGRVLGSGLVAGVALAVGLGAAGGCSRGAAKTATATRPAAVGTPPGRLYRQAEERYARRDYRGALSVVEGILARADRTDEQRAFYERQRGLCQDALAGRKARHSPAVSASLARPAAARPPADCGPRALLLACDALGMKGAPTLAELCRAAGTNADGTTLAGLKRAAERIGLTATGVQMDEAALANLSSPALAWVEGNHYVAVLAVRTTIAGETRATVRDPNARGTEDVPVADLMRRGGGVLLVLKKHAPSA